MRKASQQSNEQTPSDFNWPPTDEELAPSGIENTLSVQERLRAYFNLPADDQQEEPPAAAETATLPAPQPQSAILADPQSPSTFRWPVIGVVQKLTGRNGKTFNWPPGEKPCSQLHEPAQPALEEGVSDDWEFEVERLQALIDRLTEKLEWRAADVVLEEPRPER
jgi:hypothetical protein